MFLINELIILQQFIVSWNECKGTCDAKQLT